jgi:hypothetical protein
MVRYRVLWILIILAAAFSVLSLWLFTSAMGLGTVSGVIVDAHGPLSRARVRVRATDNLTFTDDVGHFTLTGLEAGQQIEVSAWYTGYYISSSHVTPTVNALTLTLRPYHTVDHPEYEWTTPITGSVQGACSDCHPMIMIQWSNNAHGSAISNPRFFSLYEGTDVSSTVVISPGFRLDFPDLAGNCANCHAPGTAVDGYLSTVMGEVRDVITAGIHCDFCHKVGGVFLNPRTGSVYPNVPGVQSQRVLRPPAGDNIFFGPFDDIPDPDTYLPLISESQYCAPCHQFSFWGMPIYESFEEWLASPYADEGRTCQDCHMPPTGDSYFALPEVGGLEHPPEQIPSHRQVGALDVDLLQETVSMTVTLNQRIDSLFVTVEITNTGAGHHVPTDFPGRHLILTLSPTDEQGHSLTQTCGPVVQDWGGEQAGIPGKGFAKVLQDLSTGEMPVVNYWKQAIIVEDNRIPAMSMDSSSYCFALPAGAGQIDVGVQLRFRRLFQSLADQKGWSVPDFVMEESTLTFTPQPVFGSYLPAIWAP